MCCLQAHQIELRSSSTGAMRSPPGRERRAAVAAAVQQALTEERAAQEARNARVLDILRDKDNAIAQCHSKQDSLQAQVCH